MRLPQELIDHIIEDSLKERSPAWLVVGKSERLEDYRGKIAMYGIKQVVKGLSVLDQIPFLEGLIPLRQSNLILPCMGIDSGIYADVHIIRQGNTHWVLFLSVTDEELQHLRLFEEADQNCAVRNQNAKILEEYLGKELVKALGEGKISLNKSGERRQVSILFADIRGFTSFSEGNPPEVVFATLNRYLDAMIPPLLEESAVVDKIMGDAVMGVFGILTLAVSPPHQAVVAAMKILSAVEELNSLQRASGGQALEVGIGISTGPVAVGILGSTARKSFSVVGHHVNLAARLQERAKPSEILVDKNTFDEIVAFQKGFRETSNRELKGLAGQVSVFSYRMPSKA